MYRDRISLDGVDLKFSDTVMHLGHLLSYNLDDTPDINQGDQRPESKGKFCSVYF